MVGEVRGFNAEKLNGFLKERLNYIDSDIDTLTAQKVNDNTEYLLILVLFFLFLIVKPTKKYIHVIVEQPVATSVKNLSNTFSQMTVVDNLEIARKNSEAMGNFTRIRLRDYLGMGLQRVYKIDWENTSSAIKFFNSGYDPRTITFASPDILKGNFGYYVPSASDDLHSFVCAMYILRNPSEMPVIHRGDLSSKSRVIKEYWNDKLKGPLWAEMVNAAADKNYDLLTKCYYIFTK
ncbi:35355_t:CDS:2 [Gigaspora margarita]|uniref:35355_t:CDS:1 n=1 Tax=Gigaspora margarita TaxID=4874 RepID=A0ABN7VB54_GIGMA|nr:35355_t:CDS:2 [Gigaspora margarita]